MAKDKVVGTPREERMARRSAEAETAKGGKVGRTEKTLVTKENRRLPRSTLTGPERARVTSIAEPRPRPTREDNEDTATRRRKQTPRARRAADPLKRESTPRR